MKKKLAVMIRGQLREWDDAKHSIFHTFARYEEHFDVTFFFTTWDKTYTRCTKIYHANDIYNQSIPVRYDEVYLTQDDFEKIENDFTSRGKHLGSLKIISDDIARNGILKKVSLNEEWDFIAYIRYVCNEEKRKYEMQNGMVFDLVIETRPDVFLLPPSDEQYQKVVDYPVSHFVVHTFTDTVKNQNYIPIISKTFCHIRSLELLDMFFASTSITADIQAAEFLHFPMVDPGQPHHINSHEVMCDYVMRMKIAAKKEYLRYLGGIGIVRAQQFRPEPIDFTDFSQETLAKVTRSDNLFREIRARDMEKHGSKK